MLIQVSQPLLLSQLIIVIFLLLVKVGRSKVCYLVLLFCPGFDAIFYRYIFTLYFERILFVEGKCDYTCKDLSYF